LSIIFNVTESMIKTPLPLQVGHINLSLPIVP